MLRDGLGADYADQVRHPITPTKHRRAPGLNTVLRYRGRYTAGTADIGYGGDADAGPAHQLDIWRRPDPADATAAPVLLHIPGGAWSINDKRGQGYSLMRALVERGWICVSINYRRSPHHPWPAHLLDVKQAIGWVKKNIAEYGGDPQFLAVTGGSAGGHLSALAALTANDPLLQPGFEDVDTAVAAAVPMYGVFDLTDAGLMHPQDDGVSGTPCVPGTSGRQPGSVRAGIAGPPRQRRCPAVLRTARPEGLDRARRPVEGFLRGAARGRCAKPCCTPNYPTPTTCLTLLPRCVRIWSPRRRRTFSA